MGNMHYCRFQNTLSDLRDCYDDWDTESEEEEKARERLLKLCKKIVADYGEDD
jgi:hypothetical protein